MSKASELGEALNAAGWRPRLAPLLAKVGPKAAAVVMFFPREGAVDVFPVPVFTKSDVGSMYGLANFTARSAHPYVFQPDAHLMPVVISAGKFLAMALIGHTSRDVMEFVDHYEAMAKEVPECAGMVAGAIRIVVDSERQA